MTLPNGYKMKTTFWMDFSIADSFGKRAIIDTYKRAFEEWSGDIEYVTELAIVLNYKIWQHYEKQDGLDSVYDVLWRELDNWIFENKNEDEVNYYIKITD